jgi:type II secretory pathway pseudopilin PulG
VLVVMAIVGLLLALLLPAVQAARETARRVQCASHLRQLGIATTSFEAVHKEYPPGVRQWYFNASITYRGIPLFAYLLPYLELSTVEANWCYDDPLRNVERGAQSNSALVIPVLLCPSDKVAQNPILIANRNWVYALTSYGGNGGSRSFYPTRASTDGIFSATGPASEPFAGQAPVRPRDVHDGLSQTILFGERVHDDVNYETFNLAGWGLSQGTPALDQLGWWGASTSRTMIGHVTLSALAPINFRMPFAFEERGGKLPPADTLAAFQANYVDQRVSAYGSGHPVGAQFAFADGRVDFLGSDTDLAVLRSLSTRASRD